MRRYWQAYVRKPFRRTLREVPWFGPVVSALLVTMAVDLLTQAVTAWGGVGMGWAVVLGLTLAAVGFVYVYAASESRRRKRGVEALGDLPNPGKKRGLIFLFSRAKPLREAIAYHQPRLEHCWLLVTPQMQDQASRVIQEFPDLITPRLLRDRYDSLSCYQIVRDIYRREAPRLGIPPQEVIADITGGTKPMTLGMVVACVGHEGEPYPMEHVPTAFDAEGRPTGPLPPIQIVVRQKGNGG